ncbi:Golgi apyrase [Podochytrium sp. JEL0797]|nr:Golgi apyrase [Podochytrium sp. JEL0797]
MSIHSPTLVQRTSSSSNLVGLGSSSPNTPSSPLSSFLAPKKHVAFATQLAQTLTPLSPSSLSPVSPKSPRSFGREHALQLKNAWIALSFCLCGGRQRDRIVISVLLVLFFGLVATLLASFAIHIDTQHHIHPMLPTSNASALDPTDHALLTLETGFPEYVPDFGLTTGDTIYSRDWYADRNYGIVIDAGSSGSRLLIYSWKVFDHPSQSSGLPRIERSIPEDLIANGAEWSKSITPGLSSLYSKKLGSPSQPQVSEYLSPLLQFAESLIPKHLHSTTPIYLFATAGMRLVPDPARTQILTHACETVQTTYKFDTRGGCTRQFRVISGEAEGLFGWAAVNYLNGGFTSPSSQSPPPPSPASPHTFGFMDMGGASMQIAFEPVEAMKELHRNDLTGVVLRDLDGREVLHQVFVSTFLGFGANEARRRYLEGMAVAAGFSVNLDKRRRRDDVVSNAPETQDSNSNNIPSSDSSSDVPSSTPQNITAAIPSSSTQTSFPTLTDPCLPPGLILDSDPSLARVDPLPALVGNGSLLECLSALNPHLHKDLECPDTPCLFNGHHAPIANFSLHRFIGISEYYYTPSSVHGAVSDQGIYYFDEFVKSADKICKLPWSTQLPSTTTPTQLSRLQLLCFKSAWILEILHEGFEFPRTELLPSTTSPQGNPFTPANEISGFPITWTTGVILFHICSTIAKPAPHQPTTDSTIRLFLFSLCLIVGTLLSIVFWRRYRRANASAQRRRGSRVDAQDLTSFWPNQMDEEILLGNMLPRGSLDRV